MKRISDTIGLGILFGLLFASMVILSYAMGGAEGARGYVSMIQGNISEIMTVVGMYLFSIYGLMLGIIAAMAWGVRRWRVRGMQKQEV